MNRQIDFKSLIIGVLVTVCITLAMGASVYQPGPAPESRFKIVARDNHVYVLDSTNGRVWEKFAPNTAGRTSQNFLADKTSSAATDKD